MASENPFNPLSKTSLAESVADALLAQPVSALPPKAFDGAGIYAIYYHGAFDLYGQITRQNRNQKYQLPIYVGKAVPPGARRGGLGVDVKPGKALHQRLREHARSVEEADNLRLEDFKCRYLTVDDIWIPLGEALLIQRFQPLWNTVVDGFGNHDPGGRRRSKYKSPWDIIHPGRAWAGRHSGGLTVEEIRSRVTSHLGR